MVNKIKVNKIIEEDMNYIINQDIEWWQFKNKTILITGANGLLPSYLVYTLMYLNDNINLNCKIIAVVRNEKKALQRFKENVKREDFELIIKDICDFNRVNQKIDFIIHAASQASPVYYKVDPVGTLNANVLGTNNLLKIAKDNKVEGFLFFSSGEVYGQVDNAENKIKEVDYGYLDPTEVRSCYGESKRLGETMCVSWSEQYKIPCKIVRPFHTYGPGIDFNDGRVFSDFVSNVVNNQDIIMKSDGSARRAFCYISDAIAGFFMVLTKGEIGEAYNIGNDAGEVSILELANLLCNSFSNRKIKVIMDIEEQVSNYMKSPIKSGVPDISKAKNLGWRPKITVRDGFYRTIISYEVDKDETK